jgi:hypothetical protein
MTTAPEATEPLRVLPVAQLPPEPAGRPAWLIEDLWAHQAVGLIGGAPKSGKTFLALEIALAVAAGTPCLGRFPVHDPGPVLLFAAEDAPPQVRDRLRGLAHIRGADFDHLPLFLILAEQLRLDRGPDPERLAHAVSQHQPRLLVLDPFVRIHRAEENSASEISRLLADLRTLQRRFDLAVLLVHHTRKGNGPAAGAALRGSSDFYAWGDSYLYLHKTPDHIRLTVEHRAARAPDPITLALTDEPVHLKVTAAPPRTQDTDLNQQVLHLLRQRPAPMTQVQLRASLQVRNQSLTTALRDLEANHQISRANHGWTLSSRAVTTTPPHPTNPAP